MSIATINPANGQELKTFEPFTRAQIDNALDRAVSGFEQHRRTSFADRATRMRKVAALLEKECRELGRLMTLEMGKPFKAAIAEAEKCATACNYYADNAEKFLADQPVNMDGGKSWVAFQPLGVVLAIMPWNFPFWQVFRFAAPAVMAGNVGLLKHASNVPQCALAIEDLFRRAGFAGGVFPTLLTGSDSVEGLIADRRTAAVTLTGSEGAGRAVAAAAGKNLKKSVVELGGSDPFIVMPSADFDAAVSKGATPPLRNKRQSRIAAHRFLVHKDTYVRLLDEFTRRVSQVRVGDPMDEATELGPLATAAIPDDLDRPVQGSVKAGARVLTGGEKNDCDGYFYET